jgi:hypothetical protein
MIGRRFIRILLLALVPFSGCAGVAMTKDDPAAANPVLDGARHATKDDQYSTLDLGPAYGEGTLSHALVLRREMRPGPQGGDGAQSCCVYQGGP